MGSGLCCEADTPVLWLPWTCLVLACFGLYGIGSPLLFDLVDLQSHARCPGLLQI